VTAFFVALLLLVVVTWYALRVGIWLLAALVILSGMAALATVSLVLLPLRAVLGGSRSELARS
jgi:hypothetical protein